jgi:hypothetical protein
MVRRSWRLDRTRYTRQDLLLIAAREHVRASDRLLTDWIELGLMDVPDRPGRGKGKGRAAGTWPASQARLWEVLLHRRRDVKSIVTLCNVPVFAWLLGGGDVVPTAQVQRAMTTWLTRYSTTSERRARWTSKQVVTDFVEPKTDRRARDALLDAVTRLAMTGRWDEDELRACISRVDLRDPDRAESYLGLIAARIHALTNFKRITLGDLEQARLAYLATRSRHTRGDARFKLHPQTYVSEAANNACLDVLTLLGLLMSKAHEAE